ncbi:DnaJ C-terminal domain-containing protein [Denitromonas ohlonensis]|uniref:J domain-containing protein n=2 Tax=Denitromonas TaxID=139331 RepID=A0A557S6B6_9RHOO|nr:DnaJ C-terminal domain-containing protein [Denitromonas ohlonensis]TVO59852.1 J domain-containing protein [Denitromonas ohlonensis]TVO72963.1 J domain-containing protein [Denitromonas ohlonensis]TVT47986.1 MAG: J domain-containing protein [Denitromonas halophila]TVT69124.1 MAG: J domain-containing protein [Denitromonas halophila]
MSPASRADAFAALDLAPGALPAEIKRAFRRLAMQWHPDRNNGHGAAERFRQVKAAHDYLVRGGDEDAERAADTDSAPARGPDQHETLWLDIEEAIFGGVHELELERPETCGECAGSGRVTLASSRMCSCCRGSGRVRSKTGLDHCDACGGRGYSAEATCETCAGTGETRSGRKVRVTVPAGMWPGRRLRLAGKAAPVADLPPGDLLLQSELRLHGLFALRGDTLEVSVPVPLFDLLAGGAVDVPVPGGETETVSVAAGTASETHHTLAGHGLPLRSGGRGDLSVVLQPVLPAKFGKADLDALRVLQEALAGREAKLYPSLAEWRARWLKAGAGKRSKSARKKGR